MKREFQEETGVLVEDWEYFLTMQGSDWIVFCYKAFGNYSVRSITDEDVWVVSLNDLENWNIISNLHWIIPLALDKDNVYGTIMY